MSDGSISLNKYISQTGMTSRREADKLIEQGRVKLNGQVARKGNRVSVGDVVIVDGKKIKSSNDQVYLAFHKPPGITCTTDLNDKDNIIWLPADNRMPYYTTNRGQSWTQASLPNNSGNCLIVGMPYSTKIAF